MKPVTEDFVHALALDIMPGHAANCDFGVNSTAILGAYQHVFRTGLVTPEELDQALGDGPALTELVRRGANSSNYCKDVTIRTPYDFMVPEED